MSCYLLLLNALSLLQVRAKYLARQKTKSLAKQGYELTPAHSMNSDYEQEMLAMDSVSIQ